MLHILTEIQLKTLNLILMTVLYFGRWFFLKVLFLLFFFFYCILNIVKYFQFEITNQIRTIEQIKIRTIDLLLYLHYYYTLNLLI